MEKKNKQIASPDLLQGEACTSRFSEPERLDPGFETTGQKFYSLLFGSLQPPVVLWWEGPRKINGGLFEWTLKGLVFLCVVCISLIVYAP